VAIVTKKTRILGPAPGFERVREYVQKHPLPVPPTLRECVSQGLLAFQLSPDRVSLTPGHTRELIERYPGLFRYADSAPVSSSPPFAREGFACGDGWFGILDRLSAKLVADPNLVAAQVKEKMGVLKFYTDDLGAEAEPDLALDARLYGEIVTAREESTVTCEACGEPGTHSQHNNYWRVRCEPCAWLDDMAEACQHLADIVEGKDFAAFAKDLGAVESAKYHIRLHLGAGASHQSPERRARLSGVDWAKLDLWATIDSTEKMERAEGDFTREELEAMIFQPSLEALWEFIKDDVPAVAEALR
jgi:uncharacterized protein with HEPN domain